MTWYGMIMSMILWIVALFMVWFGAMELWGTNAGILALGVGLLYRAATIDVICGMIMSKMAGAERMKKALYSRHEG